MALLESALKTALVGLGTTAGSRVYPEILPEGVTLPSIVYTRIGTRRSRNAYGRLMGLERVLFQLDCWGTNLLSAFTLANEVAELVDGYSTGHSSGDIGMAQAGDEYGSQIPDELDASNYRRILELEVWWIR